VQNVVSTYLGANRMSPIHLYQIFYNSETKALIDPDFLPLDNSANARPDWFEYWPIRNLLQEKNFSDEDYLGVFSPKFSRKTGFTGAEVHDRVARSGAEVVAFSSEFDQVAAFKNAFAQGDFSQRGLLNVSRALFKEIDLGVDPTDKWADQSRIIFSNYFVAKHSFWRQWFDFAERIFRICEGKKGAIAEQLNSHTSYRGTTSNYQMKVFVMERLVSAILERQDINAVSHFNFSHQRALYNQRLTGLGRVPLDYGRFLLLDALKGQYVKTKQTPYINLFKHYLSKKT
ncbi:MAG: hypothetical protein ACK5X3_23930, partial [Pseudomonadota bacterium]